jgi:sporulation protein YlmC with PRC-barrel domain
MTTDPHPAFICLRDSQLALADPREDIRGWRVVDENGHEIGRVDDLAVDAEERRVRFLLVDTGSLRMLGARTLLIPVAVVDCADDEVRVRHIVAGVGAAPAYDPELIDDTGHDETVHTFNRVPPITGPGHMHPGPPARRRSPGGRNGQ